MQFVIALACRYLRLTPAQALAASTINAAFAVGLGDTVGSLEVGKQADIVMPHPLSVKNRQVLP